MYCQSRKKKMGLKQQVEDICKEAKKKKGEPFFVRLPDSPMGWDEEKLKQRLYQLHNLVKRLGCTLRQVNAVDFTITKDK